MSSEKIISICYYSLIILLIFLYLAPPSIMAFLFRIDPEITLPSYKIGLSIYHLIFIFILTLLGLLKSFSKRNIFFLFFLIFSIEILHFILPYRSFELKDYLGNISGIFSALFMFYLIRFFTKKFTFSK